MKKLILILCILSAVLTACGGDPVPSTTAPTTTLPETTVPETTVPETTVPETTVPETTQPLHSDLYLNGYSLEDVLAYWDEVVLATEYASGEGDFTLVQKWLQPIVYRIDGQPTEEDLQALESLTAQLNQIPGFPGIQEAAETQGFNLTLSFLGPEDFRREFSDVVQGEDAWGATQFWYWNESNEIYDARIGYRTDIPQTDRSSIVPEEIVNTLGITDTLMRTDSIVYQHSNDNLQLSDVDWLLLKLLYHPDIRCGMDRQQCHAVIENLYH